MRKSTIKYRRSTDISLIADTISIYRKPISKVPIRYRYIISAIYQRYVRYIDPRLVQNKDVQLTARTKQFFSFVPELFCCAYFKLHFLLVPQGPHQSLSHCLPFDLQRRNCLCVYIKNESLCMCVVVSWCVLPRSSALTNCLNTSTSIRSTSTNASTTSSAGSTAVSSLTC